MRRRAAAAIALGGVTLLALVCGLEQARPASRAIQKQIEMAPVIFTAAPVYESLAALSGY